MLCALWPGLRILAFDENRAVAYSAAKNEFARIQKLHDRTESRPVSFYNVFSQACAPMDDETIWEQMADLWVSGNWAVNTPSS